MPKKEGLGLFTDLTGGFARESGVVFLRGGRGAETPMYTMITGSINIYQTKIPVVMKTCFLKEN